MAAKYWLLWCVFFWLGCQLVTAQELYVVANTSQPLELSREQVRNLYMGASLGYDLTPVALPVSHRLRSVFNTRVIGLAENRIQSYWAQMKFTGRRTPPLEMDSEAALTRYLQETPGAVGYISGAAGVPDKLTLIYHSGH